MTVKTTNRSHRLIYLVIVLVFAVALSTALLLAAERDLENSKTSTLPSNSVLMNASVWLQGKINA